LRRVFAIAVGLLALIAVPLMALAQSSSDDQKSGFLKFVQDRLSTPDRQISISNIDGALSSDASVREITVADKQGVYLRIDNVTLNWNQAALFIGRLEINTLTAQSIDYLRNPVAADSRAGLPAPEANGLAVPQLPVAVIIKALSVPKISFGAQVFGLGSAISLEGNITLDGGSLDSSLAIKRLDGPGGTLGLTAKYDKASSKLDFNLALVEPKDGIIANLLDIADRPDIKLTVGGSGPVADLAAQLSLDAGGTRALTGTASVKQQAQGFAIDASLNGPISTLIAPAYRDFFGSNTTVAARGLLRSDGGLALDGLSLSGGQLTLTGTAATSKDWFLDDLHLHGEIADTAGGTVLLPVAGADTRIKDASIAIDFGGARQNWQADLAIRGFQNASLAANILTLKGSGAGANLDDPETRRLTFNVDGALNGVTSSNPDVAAALGDSIGLGAAGLWSAGQPVQLAQFRLAGKAVSLDAAGAIDKAVFDGKMAIAAATLSPFSGVAGRNLGGGLDLKANGTISPLTGGFDLSVDGSGTDLTVDQPAADRLLTGTVRLTGGIARNAQGVSARQFRLANDQLQFVADGNFASTAADFRFDMALADLKLLTPQATGALSVTGTAKGQDSKISLDVTADVPVGALLARPLSKAAVRFSGKLVDGALSGNLTGGANLDGHEVSLASALSVAGGVNTLTGLKFVAGGTSVAGDLTQGKDGLYQGKLNLTSSNLTIAAALAMVEASGTASATIDLGKASGKQTATIAAAVRDLKASGVVVGSADIKAGIADLFGVPMINGSVVGSDIVAAGVDVKTLDASASQTGQSTNFDAKAALSTGTNVAISGGLARLDHGYRVSLDQASLTQGKLTARLAAPAALAVNGDSVTLDNIRFDVGGGSLTASGTAAGALDIAIALKSLPLSVANAVVPSLGLSGTIDGTARITGSRNRPRAQFQLTGAGIAAAAIKDFGVTPLSLGANGTFANSTVQLSSLNAQSPGGLKLSANGSVPLNAKGLDISVDGTAPLALANRFVADRGGQASGTAQLSARITGSATDPQVAGKVSVNGGSYVDPGLNLKLVGITGSATLSGNAVTIDRLTAGISTGGSISASGSVSLKSPGFAADVKLALDHARYVDRSLLVATVSGNLSLSGPITNGALLGGTIRVEKADITVPQQLGGGAADIKVRHVNLPKPVAASLARGRADVAGKPGSRAPGSPIRLDLTVSAPNQVFIRGRGLDVEMGGSVRLAGSIDDIQPVGGLELIRGRLSVLGQRLTFTSGTVTLTGNLDPEIALVASVPGDGITVGVSVSGNASDPKIDFTSDPTLPQDEVLSRLLFKQGLTQLSPLQLARLAGAASELAGGSNSSLLDSLRASTGLDDLDLITDAQGNTAVQAGRYVTDNVYLGVQAGANGQSKATVNLDITPALKANAASGTDGDSSVGVLYERDY
jgi:translocation and assembly module TamB